MTRTASALMIVAGLGAAGCGTAPTPVIAPGPWGGMHLSMEVTATGARLEYRLCSRCHRRTAPSGRRGPVHATGMHTPGHGDPIREGENLPAVRARYDGQVKNDEMSLRVTLAETGVDVGVFQLRRGARGCWCDASSSTHAASCRSAWPGCGAGWCSRRYTRRDGARPDVYAAFDSRAQHGSAEDQTTAFPPHKVIGNIYYVGTKTLSSYLITTPEGNILINSTYERNVAGIAKSVDASRVQVHRHQTLLGTHAHGDHQEGDTRSKRRPTRK